MKNKRLIDLDALLASSKEYPLVVSKNDDPFDVVERQGRKFLELVLSQPIVDAVEVVRCKDCKHYDVWRLECHNGRMNGWMGIDGFCSCGERKER